MGTLCVSVLCLPGWMDGLLKLFVYCVRCDVMSMLQCVIGHIIGAITHTYTRLSVCLSVHRHVAANTDTTRRTDSADHVYLSVGRNGPSVASLAAMDGCMSPLERIATHTHRHTQ